MYESKILYQVEMNSKYTTLSYLREDQTNLDLILATENLKRIKEGKDQINSRSGVIKFLIDYYRKKEGI